MCLCLYVRLSVRHWQWHSCRISAGWRRLANWHRAVCLSVCLSVHICCRWHCIIFELPHTIAISYSTTQSICDEVSVLLCVHLCLQLMLVTLTMAQLSAQCRVTTMCQLTQSCQSTLTSRGAGWQITPSQQGLMLSYLLTQAYMPVTYPESAPPYLGQSLVHLGQFLLSLFLAMSVSVQLKTFSTFLFLQILPHFNVFWTFLSCLFKISLRTLNSTFETSEMN